VSEEKDEEDEEEVSLKGSGYRVKYWKRRALFFTYTYEETWENYIRLFSKIIVIITQQSFINKKHRSSSIGYS
jgi:hypothetical protein